MSRLLDAWPGKPQTPGSVSLKPGEKEETALPHLLGGRGRAATTYTPPSTNDALGTSRRRINPVTWSANSRAFLARRRATVNFLSLPADGYGEQPVRISRPVLTGSVQTGSRIFRRTLPTLFSGTFVPSNSITVLLDELLHNVLRRLQSPTTDKLRLSPTNVGSMCHWRAPTASEGFTSQSYMTRTGIESLLASFPKLIPTGTQHTTVETADMRYVYQPLEELYILLITTKASNTVLQDVDTLHLFARVVSDLCRSADEREISTKASHNSATSTTRMTASTSKLYFFSGKPTILAHPRPETIVGIMSDPIRRPSLSAVIPNANLPPPPNSSPAVFKSYSYDDAYTVNSLDSFLFGNAHSGGSVSASPVSLLDYSTDDDSIAAFDVHTTHSQEALPKHGLASHMWRAGEDTTSAFLGGAVAREVGAVWNEVSMSTKTSENDWDITNKAVRCAGRGQTVSTSMFGFVVIRRARTGWFVLLFSLSLRLVLSPTLL
ncbi:hypothetical protein BDZ89DRAFT_1232704 [Hymenopellis radicata]|nr:hypothetical protein BDZ89DRAFT_1232704 [Hymenopellis radicata]